MATIQNIKTASSGHEFSCEFHGFSVSFVNALRRICLSGIPTVGIKDVQILENTTQMPHEMLRHRVEMIPINVRPDDVSTIRDAKIELRIIPSDKDRIITTDDFVVESGREGVLMKDRDFHTPSVFLRVRAGERVHITGRLSLDTDGITQVSTATTWWVVDPELAKKERKNWVDAGKDVREFDNFYIQRCYYRDDSGRPTVIGMSIESIGVLKSKEILEMAVKILRKKLGEYVAHALEHVQRIPNDEGSYKIESKSIGYTEGYLLQSELYADKNLNFVSFDLVHPLVNDTVLKMNTPKSPESVLKSAKESIEEYCSIVEKVL